MNGLYARAVAPVGYWGTALQQQTPATPVTPLDSVVVESPLPGGVAAVTRFLLNAVPPWVQIGGIILAVVVGIALLWYLVRHREAIRAWLTTRSRGVTVALGIGALVLVAAMVSMGTATWNYTQHSNDFCTGCHVMDPAFQKFGNAENEHAELSCHDCHQQSLMASARQLYLWVKERPEEIGEHATVPNQICETCHVTGDTARWQRVASTAGHRVHLESDSSALANVQCVTCHGEEVHRFRPVSGTCGQSGCHEQSETDIVLGKMATQTVRHCTSCHEFTADVPALATTDSARGTLVPGQSQCLGCHEMQRVLGDFDAAKEPHGAKCGTCHNPHTQETPAAAAATCTTSGCHSNWREEPFHVGAAHRRVGQDCLTCHAPHSARVDASNCAGCHADVRSRGTARPPMPFDTTRALRRTSHAPVLTPSPRVIPSSSVIPSSAVISSEAPALRRPARLRRAPGDEGRDRSRPDRELGPPGVGFTGHWPGAGDADISVAWPPPAAADTFSHTRHARLACLVCHRTSGDNRLTFEPPRGCTICHHQASTTARCAACHQPNEVETPMPATMTVTVPGHQPVPRPVDFLHSRHTAQTCLACHTTPVTLAPVPGIAQCKDCHTDHHVVDRTCSACHAVADARVGHPTLEAAHQRCDACHTGATIAQLTPTRNFCAACHTPQATNHYDQKQCTVCHFLAEPGAYRPKLTTPPR
ncbi:MAG TPA: hypothetical protein VFZ21_12525 [Gemmatimonadaceae bacterium]|nr:hypothetical protein [Gemmatimonadaceae bacterium]